MVVNFSGANAVKAYTFTPSASQCNNSLDTSGLITYTTGVLLSGHTHNGEYFCAYGKDNGGNVTTVASSFPLHISDLYFADPVSSVAVGYDMVSIADSYLSTMKYAFVANAGGCNSSASFSPYTETLRFTTIAHNGQYLCIYGQDADGSGRYLASSSAINIDPSLPSLLFSDDVSSHAVLSDTISLQVVGGIYSSLGYKFIDSSSACSST